MHTHRVLLAWDCTTPASSCSVAKSCSTLCSDMAGSTPGFPVPLACHNYFLVSNTLLFFLHVNVKVTHPMLKGHLARSIYEHSLVYLWLVSPILGLLIFPNFAAIVNNTMILHPFI